MLFHAQKISEIRGLAWFMTASQSKCIVYVLLEYAHAIHRSRHQRKVQISEYIPISKDNRESP